MKNIFMISLFLSSSVYGVTCSFTDQNGNKTVNEISSGTCPDQNPQAQSPQNQPPQASSSSKAASCTQKLKLARAAQGQPVVAGAPVVPVDPELQTCRALEVVADSWGSPLVDTDVKQTSDKVATCTLRAGYTTDFNSCKSTAAVYNTILTLDSLLLASQAIRNTTSQTNIQTTANSEIAAGNGQTAIYDATLASNEFKKNLNREQLLAYTTAVALMGTKLASWKSGCGSSKVDLAKYPPFTGTCETALGTAKTSDSRSTVANNDAKSAFAGALIGFVAKAAQAKATIDSLNANSAIVSAAKDATSDLTSAFETCVINPLDASCITTPTTTTTTSELGTTDYTAGEGTGNNSFDLGSGTTSDAVATTTTDANGGVATPTSPFSDTANAAKDILNPANAASVSPGSSGGGGSGGASGGMGGGGASLGSDLQGADKGDKTSEIKAGSANGAYSASGSKGFSALSSGKEDNPFASMFDSKSQGGLEEDRSIASDSGTAEPGLFQKISNRYQKIAADKRVEAGHE